MIELLMLIRLLVVELIPSLLPVMVMLFNVPLEVPDMSIFASPLFPLNSTSLKSSVVFDSLIIGPNPQLAINFALVKLKVLLLVKSNTLPVLLTVAVFPKNITSENTVGVVDTAPLPATLLIKED